MNELQMKLKLINYTVAARDPRRHIDAVRAAVERGDLKLVKTVSHLSWSEYPFEDPKSVSTYEDCVSLYVFDDTVELHIWNGDTMYGNPTERRVSYSFEGKWWVLKALVTEVEREFINHCDAELVRREEAERQKRSARLGKFLLMELETEMGDISVDEDDEESVDE